MQTVEIHGNALPVTAFNGVRVLTTERLAKVFGAPKPRYLKTT